MHDQFPHHPIRRWTLPQRARQHRTAIDPFPIPHRAIPVYETEESEAIRFGQPTEDATCDESVEHRYCLASLVPDLEDATAFALQPTPDDSEDGDLPHANGLPAFRDAAGMDKLYTLMHALGYPLYGGTGLNQGRFYGVRWPQHGMHYAYEPLSYLSLVFTPFCTLPDGNPLVFTDLDILVVTGEAMDNAGLPAGYGTALSWTDFGQIRTLVGDGSIGKGVAIGFDTAQAIGLPIPAHWQAYDLVICADDLKINPLPPGAYTGSFGVTWDNIQTIAGQSIRLGFEFWQFLRPEAALIDALQTHVQTEALPSYDAMVLGMENARQLAAYRNNDPYEPLTIHSKLMEALSVLGPTYPWVAQKLEATVANYLLTKPFTGTRYKLTIVVHDWVQHAYRHTEEGDAHCIGGKYPITAGLMQLAGTGESTAHFLVLEQSTADHFAIDSDGDAAFVCAGPLFEMMLNRDLVKPVRDIAVTSRRKRTTPLTLPNMARDAWQIMQTSGDIGSLTLGYYCSEIANDTLAFDIDLSPYFCGIEAVIKSSKHEMDLSILEQRDWETEQLLKSELAMPYQRANLTQLRTQINTGVISVDALNHQRISDPPHYMEHLWNATLDRIRQEISMLRDGVQPLGTFANHIGPVLLPKETDPLDQEIEHITALHGLWRELRPGGRLAGQARALVNTVTTVGTGFSIEALRIAVREYLTGVNGSKSSGSFVIHLANGRLNRVFDSTTLEYTVENRATGSTIVRVYSPDIEAADFSVADAVQVNGELPETDQVLFLPADHSPVQDFTGYRKVTAFPYLSQHGRFTKSLWLMLQPISTQ